MIKNLSLLTYTHSNCFDLHKIYYDSIDKYFTNNNHHTLTNKSINDQRFNQIIYDDNTEYYEQMLLGLSKIETEYLIYSQEDYILYDNVNTDILTDYVNLLNNQKNIMFIRLISSGISGNEKDYDDDFVIINSDDEYFFSTQITIWRKDILIKMFEQSKTKFISDEPKNSPFLKSLDGLGLCTKLKGEKVGGHYNSIIYPYTATGIIKGKWNLSEYGVVIEKLLEQYKIDKHIRGMV